MGGNGHLFDGAEIQLVTSRAGRSRPSMIASKAATNDHLKTGHHEVTETGFV
jgi:hypothetical protein